MTAFRGSRNASRVFVDGASYLLLNTMKLQFKLVAEAPSAAMGDGQDVIGNYDLEMLGPPHAVCFQSASLKVCGQSVELLEDFGRSYLAMEQLRKLII